MTVQLASLRVSAQLDGSNYVAGANAISAANDEMSATGKAVGQTITTTQNKVNSAGDAWTRLSRQYVDGAVNAQKLDGALRTLQRGMDTGTVSMEQAEQVVEGLYRKLGLLANEEELAANGQKDLAAVVSATNARIRAASGAHDDMGKKVGLNRVQVQMFTHEAKSMFDMLAAGQSPFKALSLEAGGLADALSMGEGGVAGSLSALAPILLPVIATLALGATAVAGLTSAIDQNTGKTVSWMDTLKAVFQSLGDLVKTSLTPVGTFISTYFGHFVEWISPGVKMGFNLFVGAWKLAFDDVGTIMGELPSVMGEGVVAAVNGVIGIINGMISSVIGAMNGLIDQVNSKLHTSLGTLGNVGVSQVADPFAGATGRLFAELGANGQRDTGYDYAGAAFGDIQKHALQNAANDNAKKAGKAAEEAAKSFAKLMASADADTNSLMAQIAALGQTSEQTAYLEEKQKLVNKAEEEGLKLSPSQLAAIDAAAQAYANQKAKLEALTAVYNAGKDAFQGFFSDLSSNMRQGQTFWEAFATAAENALNKIEDKLIDLVTSQAWDALWTGGSTSGSGGLGGLLSGVLGAFGLGGSSTSRAVAGSPLYAWGGYTGTGGKFEPAGVVHRGEYVFDAAATSRIGVGTLEAMRRNASGYAGGGMVGGSANGNWGISSPNISLSIVNRGQPLDVRRVSTTRTADGGIKIEALVDAATARNLATSGSKTNRAQRTSFGSRPQLTKR